MWFIEDPWSPILLCAVGVLIGLAMWSSSKRVGHLAIAVVACLIAAGGFVVDELVVTEPERVEQLTVKLCQDFQQRKPDGREAFSPTAPELRELYDAALALVTIDKDLRLTDFHSKVTNNATRATVHFRANATMSVQPMGNVGRQPARFELTWAKEGPDWRIIKVTRLHPIKDEELGVLDRSAS